MFQIERRRGDWAQRTLQMIYGNPAQYVGELRSWRVYAMGGKAYLFPSPYQGKTDRALVCCWFELCAFIRRAGDRI